MLFKKLKLRKYKEIFLIDTENIGYTLPDEISKDVLIYMFISDLNIISHLELETKSYKNQIEIINIHQILRDCRTKNGMDFCLVTKLGEILEKVTPKQKIMILSQDKGYDVAIEFSKQRYPDMTIERYPISITTYYIQGKQNFIHNLSEEIYQLIPKYSSMKDLKRHINKKERKKFCFEEYIDPISKIKIYVEYDVYQNYFSLYYSGERKGYYETLEEAKEKFQVMVSKVQKKYQKYYSHELYVKAKQMKMNVYFEEAALKNISLLECLILHFGKETGIQMFHSFVSQENINMPIKHKS